MCWSRGARKGASTGMFTLPGGVVEAGETLHEAIVREVTEETGIAIEPVALAGYREHRQRDETAGSGGISSSCRLPAAGSRGEGVPLLEELSELRWLRPSGLAELRTTPGLAAIVAAAFERMEAG